MGLIDFAKSELDIILKKCEDEEGREMQQKMNEEILEIIKVFAQQGHSDFSAGYAINLINKLLRYEPITPLTGEDDEWVKLYDDDDGDAKYQNKRCSRIFKTSDGRAYDMEGKVFSDNGGRSWYIKGGGGSRTYIEFPYTPKTEKIFVEVGDE